MCWWHLPKPSGGPDACCSLSNFFVSPTTLQRPGYVQGSGDPWITPFLSGFSFFFFKKQGGKRFGLDLQSLPWLLTMFGITACCSPGPLAPHPSCPRGDACIPPWVSCPLSGSTLGQISSYPPPLPSSSLGLTPPRAQDTFTPSVKLGAEFVPGVCRVLHCRACCQGRR